MRGGVFQPHGGRQGGVHRGGGDFQIPGTNFLPVRKRLVCGSPECQEGTPSMELSGETAKEGMGGTVSVQNILSDGGPGTIYFGGVDLGLASGNVLKAG